MATMNKFTTLNKKDNVDYLTFDRLSEIPFIRHGFSTKNGGVSKGIFATMNLSFSRGDDKEAVLTNYNRLFSAIGLTLDNMIMSDQIHETDIMKIDEKKLEEINEKSNGLEDRVCKNMDGLITNLPNVPLVTFYADCVPLYFVDIVNKAIGLSHSGWRGTVKGMGIKTVEAMTREYGSNPQDIIAVVGPSICRDCYEVSKEVVDEFHKEYDGKFDVSSIYYAKENGKMQLDLWEANRQILLLAGLKPENIVVSEVCTSCHSDLLFSHRKTNGKRGNLVAVMEIV